LQAVRVAQPATPPGGPAGPLEEGLELLRRVDSYVDLSRGWLQLRLLVELGRRGGEAAVSELAAALGVERKAVLDSLRKMRQKGLVTRGKRGPALTERGADLYRSLLRAIGAGHEAQPPRRQPQAATREPGTPRDAYRLLALLTRHHYLYEALLALAAAPRGMLPLEALASLTGLSPRQMDEYLQVYARSEPRILARTVKETRLGPLRRQRIYYRLTREGEKLLHRLPSYTRARRSRAARLLAAITRTLHPTLALKRLMLLVSAGSAAAMAAAALEPGLAPLLLGAWLLAVTATAVLVEATY